MSEHAPFQRSVTNLLPWPPFIGATPILQINRVAKWWQTKSTKAGESTSLQNSKLTSSVVTSHVAWCISWPQFCTRTPGVLETTHSHRATIVLHSHGETTIHITSVTCNTLANWQIASLSKHLHSSRSQGLKARCNLHAHTFANGLWRFTLDPQRV